MLNTGNSTPSEDSLREVVYEIVAQIPQGRVLTYGAIARLAGYPNHSRLVGRVMRGAPDGQLPCHRVVGGARPRGPPKPPHPTPRED
ncbi:MAG: MGMT family protein, partial [Bacteroidales bacterium]|nr:MGMT family protein [Bacteroidales bacterium]